jgi:MFS transporter, FHS family, glucose/mannose:H+ symporter
VTVADPNLDHPRPDDESVTFTRSAFVGATITLALVGGLAAAYGTFLIGIANQFHLHVATAGITLSVNFAGGVVGVALCWRALRHWSGSRVWAVALTGLSAGLTLAALAPNWATFIVAIGVAGIGFGALDFAMVALVARTAREGLAARLSVSGSGWALGAIAGPLVIVMIRPHHFEWLLAGAAAIGVALILLSPGITTPPNSLGAHQRDSAGRVPRRRSVLVTFAVALGLYVALESALSGWLATQLHGWGYTSVVGASVTAGFWAGLAIGRISLARGMHLVAGHWFVLIGLAVTAALLVAASDRTLAPYAYPAIGFALAAIFPVGLHWFTEVSPNDHDGVAWLVLADMVGGALGTGAENVAVANDGLRAVPWVAVILTVLCIGSFTVALRFPTNAIPLVSPTPAPRERPFGH